MSSNTDDVDDEYLDDPISLMAIDIKKEVDADEIIDIQTSSDEETYTSSYGKKNFVLPVKFFDSTRNIRLLSKCKPISISIVDCKQYPTYYIKSEEKNNTESDVSSEDINDKHKSDIEPNSIDVQNVAINTSITIYEIDKKEKGEKKLQVHDVCYKSGENNNSKSDDSSIEIDNKYRSDSEHEPNSVDAQNVVLNSSKTIYEAHKKESEKKRRVHDVYYENGEKSNCKSDDSSVEIDNKHRSTSEHELDAQNDVMNTSITIHDLDKKKEGDKRRRPRGESYYEKLKTRKENRKQDALNCKDLSQVDFKRNTGLVGLKITDAIFKQIVCTEKALVKSKKPAETKSKESNENSLEKLLVTKNNDTPEEKCKETFSGVEKALSVVKSAEPKLKENKRSDSEKGSVAMKSIDSSKDKNKETSESVVERALTETNLTQVEDRFNDLEKDAQNTIVRTNMTSAKDSSKEKSESNKYMKEVGAALDNLGTTIIPVTDTHTKNAASNNITVTETIENKSIKTHKNSATIIDKVKISNDIEMRCSLKIPSREIVEKVLKLKEMKSISKHVSDVLKNTNVQQNQKEIITKSFNTKPIKRSNIDGSCLISEKDKLQNRSMGVVTYSRQKKQLEKPVTKNERRNNPPGSNSPVIPCTTITIRATPPKSTQNMSSANNFSQSVKKDNATVHITPPILNNSLPPRNIDEPIRNDAQKKSQLPNIATMSQADGSNNTRCTHITHNESPKQITIVTQTKVKASSDSKDTSMSTQSSTANLKTLKITEYKPSNNNAFVARLIDIKNNVSAPNLADQNKTNLTKEANQVNAPIKSATFSGNTVHITNHTTNGLIKNQSSPNLQMSPSANPKFSRNNAIIFRRPPQPPSRDFQNNTPPNHGQPIQTAINYRPHLHMPHGSTPMRFRLPPPYPPPPPNYPPPPPNYSSPPNLMQIRPNQMFIPNRMSPTYMRGLGIGLRLPGPTGCRTPLQVPPRQDNIQMNQGPQSPQVNNQSFIGNTANGDPIKKINIPRPAVTDTVNDKQMMLSELNNAIMSPELTANKVEYKPSNDQKRKADPRLTEPVKPKYSKPCPLSKKINGATDLNTQKVFDKASPNFGYSPPILPIMTYEESFQKFKNDTNTKKCFSIDDTQNCTPSSVKCSASIMKLDNKKQKRTHTDGGKQDKAKKITFEDYRKRAKDGADRIDVDKIRKHNESKNVTDDYNQDLGYDSDSTVKL